jgi:hypothetical protein
LEGVARDVLTQIKMEWQGTRLEKITDISKEVCYAVPGECVATFEVAPLMVEKPLETPIVNPITSFLTALAQLPPGVVGGLQVMVRPDQVTQKAIYRKAQAAAYSNLTSTSKTKPALRQQEKKYFQRAELPFLETKVIVWAKAGSQDLAASTARELARAYAAQFGGQNPVKVKGQVEVNVTDRVFPLFEGMPVSAPELGLMAHLVGKVGKQAAPQFETAPAKALPPTPSCRIPTSAATWEKVQ